MRFRPRYADVVGTLALVLATSGGAYAVTQLLPGSVGTKHLKDGAVTRPKIAAGAVNSAKVANGSLFARDFAPGQTLRWRGAWVPSIAYQRLDVVTRGGATYAAIVSSTNQAPPGAAWSILAQRGTDGDPGVPGAPGLSFGDGATMVDPVLIPCTPGAGVTTLMELPMTTTSPAKVFAAASGSWFQNIWNLDNSGKLHTIVSIAAASSPGLELARTSGNTEDRAEGAAPSTASLQAGGILLDSAGDPFVLEAGTVYIVSLRLDTYMAGTCDPSYRPQVQDAQLSAVIVGNNP